MTVSNSKQKPKYSKVGLLPPKFAREKLMAELVAAHAAVGELRGYLGSLQNPELLIAPFRKREAVASSAIEGTRATLDEVMEFEAIDPSSREEVEEHDRKGQDVLEVINYERAMSVAMRELKSRPIGENLLKRTHFTLLDSVRGTNKDRGNFRRAPVAVGDYIPPIHTELKALITNWERYLNTDKFEPDPLIRMGVAHYQFEAIHPFMDGNGRIGRLIIPLYLCQVGTLVPPVLYISHYFERYKVEYQSLLHEVDLTQDWVPWLRFFLKAVESQAKVTTKMAKEIQELYERLKSELIGELRSPHTIEMIDLMFRQPVLSASRVNSVISAKSKATAYNLIDKFVETGVIAELFVQGKEKFYGFTELRKLLRR